MRGVLGDFCSLFWCEVSILLLWLWLAWPHYYHRWVWDRSAYTYYNVRGFSNPIIFFKISNLTYLSFFTLYWNCHINFSNKCMHKIYSKQLLLWTAKILTTVLHHRCCLSLYFLVQHRHGRSVAIPIVVDLCVEIVIIVCF